MDPAATVQVGDLTAEEVRVLGCLIEKEATVPESYPLTVNSLRNACNQSTSRDPVVSYGDYEIENALTTLRGRGLTRTVHSTSNRATKYRHVVPEALSLDAAETAILSVLMLRGPQTIGELKGRTERQHKFESTDQVAALLAALATREQPLARQLERAPGQKDARWTHLLMPYEAAVSRESQSAGRSIGNHPVRNDPYGEATAEFYDLLAANMWESFGLDLLDLLADVDPAVGPIVDIGSGSGVGLAYLQAAVPGADVIAIEPSKAMRTALHTRLAMDDSLRAMTTVVPRTLADAPLPNRACALVVLAALGHLADPERTRMWRFIAEQMPPGAPAVIGILPPDRSLTVPLTRYRRLQVGHYSYEGWQHGEPLDDRTMAWTLIYKVLDGDHLIAEHTASSTWRCDSIDDIRSEIAPFGLTLTEHHSSHQSSVIVRVSDNDL